MTGRHRIGDRIARGVIAAPDRLIVALFWISLVVVLAIMASQFHPWIVLPAVAVTIAATWRFAPTPLPRTRAQLAGAVGALAVAGAFVAVHQPYASRFVIVNRDPGFLTLGGMWLSRHPEAVVPLGDAQAVAQEVSAFVTSAGYQINDDVLHVQGANLLPGLLGGLGWVGGDSAILSGNLLIGALALLALYGLARRATGPLWALVPTIALACSMPLGAFSRAAYTEPLTLALAFGGLTVLWDAFGRRSPAAFALGGAMIGATALARIDGAAVVVGLIAATCLAAAGAVTPVARRHLRTGLYAAAGGSLALTVLGYLDLRLFSTQYLTALGNQFGLLVAALAVTTAVGLVLTVPRRWDPARRWVLRRRRALGAAAVVLVGAVAAFLTSRPLWDTPRRLEEGTPYSGLVGALQAIEGLESDPTRSYDEKSILWLTWYYGWPMVLLAFVGLAFVAWRAFAHRDPRHLLLLGVIGAPSVLFLYRVSITPDQIWAVRRLLPVTIPGFLLAATVALVALWGLRHRIIRGLTVAMAAVVALSPVIAWGPMFTVVEHAGRYEQLMATCAELPTEKVAYLRHTGGPFLLSLRTACGVEAIEFRTPPSQEDLARLHELWGPVTIVSFTPDGAPWTRTPLVTSHVETTQWATVLTRPPDSVDVRDVATYVGVLRPDGTVEPIR